MTPLEILTHYAGRFEYHITVQVDDAKMLTYFKQFCALHQVKPIIIQLIKGDSPIQPMLSKRIFAPPELVWQDIKNLRFALEQAGFMIKRLKIEASIKNDNIPLLDRQAQGLAEQFYFEHHFKLRLNQDYPLEELKQAMQAYAGHVSANAFWQNEFYQYQFITQRFRNIGLESASFKIKALLAFIKSKHIKLVKLIREYNIYDSNIDLDQGWL